MQSLLNFQRDLSKRIFKSRSKFIETPLERLTKEYIENRLELLDSLWSEFRQGHKELLQQIEPSLLENDPYITGDIYEDTEEEFMLCKCELKTALARFSTVNLERSNLNERNSSQVKLPKIIIPTFSGKYTEWTSLRDLFLSMIHNNSTLDNVQKLQYLKGYLSGEAEQLIRHIPVTEANYLLCWKQLDERYNNKKYLSHCILQRLLTQSNATTESASFLKELLDTSSDCLNALSNLGVDVSNWDIIIIHLLSVKLDPETRKQWELKVTANVTSDSLPTFVQFKEFLTGRFRALEFIEPSISSKPEASKENQPVSYSASQANVFHATATNICCEFCSEGHKLCFCKKFANLEFKSRHEFVTNNRICYNCLGGNHGVRYCQKTTNCRICNKRHHSLLHPKSVTTSTPKSGIVVQAVEGMLERDRSQNEVKPINTHTDYCAKSIVSKQVLLATAIVKAEDSRGQLREVRAVVDQGSQASFVTEATAQSLGLKKIPALKAFCRLGGSQSSVVSEYMVSMKIKSTIEPSFETEIEAFVLKNITSNLPNQEVNASNWLKSQSLLLADPRYNLPGKIDVLLGAEVCSQIMTDGVLRGPKGTPLAQHTQLGWILSGPIDSATDSSSITGLHTRLGENKVTKRFWELEANRDLLMSKMFTKDSCRCAVEFPFRHGDRFCKDGSSIKTSSTDVRYVNRGFVNNSWRNKNVCSK